MKYNQVSFVNIQFPIYSEAINNWRVESINRLRANFYILVFLLTISLNGYADIPLRAIYQTYYLNSMILYYYLNSKFGT